MKKIIKMKIKEYTIMEMKKNKNMKINIKIMTKMAIMKIFKIHLIQNIIIT